MVGGSPGGCHGRPPGRRVGTGRGPTLASGLLRLQPEDGRTGSRLVAAVGCVLVAVMGSACVVAPMPVVEWPPPPPAPAAETLPVTPGPTYVWVPGHWAWSPWHGRYLWVPGRYVQPPGPAYVWVPGFWAPSVGGHIWIGGHWRIR